MANNANDCDMQKKAFKTQQKKVELPNGTKAEVLSVLQSPELMGEKFTNKQTLVFIHGSFHAAWCWAENYFEYFALHGYDCFALSLRGTGGTFAGENVKKVKIMDHVSDLGAFLQYVEEANDIPKQKEQKPILIAHSFGGLAVMKYLETNYPEKAPSDVLSGICMFCSVPPSGNGKMTLRYLTRSLRDSWQITAGFAMKKCIDDPGLCRLLFFATKEDPTGGISDEDISRYQFYFDRDTAATIDLGDLAKRLPSASSRKNGKAPFITTSSQFSSLVVGASDDFIVDKEGVEETSRYFGVGPVIVDSPHDVMLGPKWRNGAETLLQWINSCTLH